MKKKSRKEEAKEEADTNNDDKELEEEMKRGERGLLVPDNKVNQLCALVVF